MKVAISFAVCLAACGTATAQMRQGVPYPSSAEIRAAGQGAIGRMQGDAFYGSGNRAAERHCLTERKTGRTVCKTREEWKREATRIASSQRQDSTGR